LVTPLLLAGCAMDGITVAKPQNPACGLMTPIIDRVTSDIDAAMKSAALDPNSAIDQLKTARAIVAPIADQLPESRQATAAQDVVDTIDRLIPILNAEAAGTTTTAGSDELTRQLSKQMKALTTLC
jgi:hypothetical protein